MKCARCRGQLYHDGDRWGTYTACLQCGWVSEDLDGPLLPRVMNNERREMRQAKRRKEEPRSWATIRRNAPANNGAS